MEVGLPHGVEIEIEHNLATGSENAVSYLLLKVHSEGFFRQNNRLNQPSQMANRLHK